MVSWRRSLPIERSRATLRTQRGVTMRFDGYKRSEYGSERRFVGGLPSHPRAAKQLAIVLVVSLLAGPSAFGQTRKYRSITWEKFKASGPELKQIGWLAVRHARDIESSSWSVGCETLDRDQARRRLGARNRLGGGPRGNGRLGTDLPGPDPRLAHRLHAEGMMRPGTGTTQRTPA